MAILRFLFFHINIKVMYTHLSQLMMGLLSCFSHVRLCKPMDCNLPGSSVHEILQARVLEWVAISYQGIFPTQGLNLCFLHLPAFAGRLLTTSTTWETLWCGSVQFSCSVLSNSLWPHVTPCQASLSITNSRSLLKLMSIDLVMPFNHLILCRPFTSCLQSFPASGSFPMSQFFARGGQSIVASASASVLPVNIQDWSPLGLTGLISLQSKGLSRVFSKTTFQKHQFFSAQLSLWSH